MLKNSIMISGLTAAGKTTHCRLLSDQLGWGYVSASKLLLEASGRNLSTDTWFSKETQELDSMRVNDKSFDRWVDKRLLEIVAAAQPTIYDSWGLPWIAKENALRIWLESTLESRTFKSIVSVLQRGLDPPLQDEAKTQLIDKDNVTRKYFQEEYSFDLFNDHQIYDLKIDISDFIEGPTIPHSQVSVRLSHEIITAAVQAYFQPSNENLVIWQKCFYSNQKRIRVADNSPLASILPLASVDSQNIRNKNFS